MLKNLPSAVRTSLNTWRVIPSIYVVPRRYLLARTVLLEGLFRIARERTYMNINSNVKHAEETRRFAEECKVIDLWSEYNEYIGEERYALVSEFTEAQLSTRYPEIIRKYAPFVLLSTEQGAVIDDFHRNEKKHYMRQIRHGEVNGYEEGVTEALHPETLVEDCLIVVEERETREEEILLLKQVMAAMSDKQRERVIKFYHNKTTREIAEEEGVHHSAIDKSIRKAMRMLKKKFQEEGLVG